MAPTPEQDALFPRFAGVCRMIHNMGREHGSVRHTGSRLDYAAQCRELTARRVAFDGAAAISETCQEQALRALDRAIGNCFKAAPSTPGCAVGAITMRFGSRAGRSRCGASMPEELVGRRH